MHNFTFIHMSDNIFKPSFCEKLSMLIPLSSAKVGSNLTYFQSKVCQPGLLSIQSNLLSIQSNGDQRGRRRRGINRKDVSQVTDFGKFGLKVCFRG